MVAAIGAVAGVAGAAINASAAGDAASAQSGASQQAQMMQYMAQQQMKEDLKPWTQSGAQAQGLLNQYLGLGVGGSGVTSMGLATGMSPDQVRAALMAQYTSKKPTAASQAGIDAQQLAQMQRAGLAPMPTGDQRLQGLLSNPAYGRSNYNNDEGELGYNPASQTDAQYEDVVDYDGLNAAIKKYYDEQAALNDAASKDPRYGSLLTPYRNGQEFSFTGENLASDPGYQFGLNQGTQGIERGQASRGNFLSGAAMKELTRFNEDYAGTKFNDAFNRAQSTWNTNLNAYDNNRARIYDFLTGVSRTGQNSAAQVGTANNATASAMANNALSTGNVNAASAIASGNAWQSGLNSAANSINSAGGWNALLGGTKPSVYSAGGSAGAGFGTGAMFGNQDIGQYLG